MERKIQFYGADFNGIDRVAGYFRYGRAIKTVFLS